MLNNILQSLGLRSEEVELYVFILETQPITVGKLSKKIGKPRSSLYGFLKKLQEKGVVVESVKGGIKTFSTEPLEKINFIFRQKIENLENSRKMYNEILPSLEKRFPSKLLTPKFQLYEGESGLQHILKDMLLYNDIETYAFWPIKSMVEVLSADFFRYHNKERIKNNIYVKAIWPKQKIVDIKNYPYLGYGKDFKREIRISPKGIDFSMGYWIYKNKVAFVSSRKESFGFIIESKELTEMLMSQFETVWNISKKIQGKPDQNFTN